MSFRRRALFLAGLFAAVSCSDAGNPLGPGAEPPVQPGPGPDEVLAALTCTVSVDSPEMRCAPPSAGTGGALGNVVIIGGLNGENVRLTKLDHNANADSMWFDVTLQNLIGQTLGTVDGVTPDADSIRVFFASEPTPVGGGDVTVGHPDGAEPFTTGAPQPYYRYASMLADSATTAPHRWHFNLSGGVSRFTFTVFVRAKVQFPEGWVRILPDSASLEIGGVDSLLARVRDRFGGPLGDQVEWSLSDSSKVSIAALTDSTAEITGLAQGSSWVHAVSAVNGNRRDSILVKVANRPIVTLDSIAGLTNVTDSVPAADGLAANVPAGASIVPGTYVTADSGTATVYADGSYTYRSRAGAEGVGKDTIFYPVTNGAWTVEGKVVVQVALSPYWYVQAGAAGDGRDRSPFGSLADAVAAAADLDSIFVLSSGAAQLEGGVTLKAGQSLIGQGIPTSITRPLNGRTHTLLAAGAAPSITRTDAGAAITLATDNAIQGLGITAADGAAIEGANFGTLFVRHAGVNPRGPALLLNTGALDAEFDVLSSTESNAAGLHLTGVTGSLTGTGGSLMNPAFGAFIVMGGDATITYGGSVVDTMASAQSILVSGRTGGAVTLSGTLMLDSLGIEVQNNTGGTIAFTGASKTLRAGSHAAVVLWNNTGASVVFAGGGLEITGTATQFGAANGGTVEVTGPGNTIASGTGTALFLDGVGTGTAGVNFRSVSATGAGNGISLTGVTGAGVQVTGTAGVPGSGGTIAGATGHAVTVSAMAGVPVILKRMTLGGGAGGNAGIFASAAQVTVDSVAVSVTGGPALSISDSELNGIFTTLSSTASASNALILSNTTGSITAHAGTLGGATSTTVAVVGGSVGLAFAGDVSQAAAAPLLAVNGGHTGALAFTTGTLSATAGPGMEFDNADGSYTFGGTTTLNGGTARVALTSGADGVFHFGINTNILTTTATALEVDLGPDGGSPALVYRGAISSSAGRVASVSWLTADSVMVLGNFSNGTSGTPTGQGILVQNSTGGKVAFNGTSKQLHTGTSPAVTLTGNPGAEIEFRGGGLAVTTTTGAGFTASGGGQVIVTGAANTLVSGTGTPLSLNGVSTGPAGTGVVLASVNASGAASGIAMTDVTGVGVMMASGTISHPTAAGIAISGGSAGLTMSGGSVNQGVHAAPVLSVSGGHTGAVTFAGGGLNATTGTGLQFDNADGTYLFNGSSSMNGGDAGLDIVNGSSGSFTFVAGNNITNPSGPAIRVSASSPAPLRFEGGFSKASAGRMVEIVDQASGTISLGAGGNGQQVATAGDGILLSNVDGTVNFYGHAQMSGGAGVDVVSGSSGNIFFNSSTSIVSATGPGVHVQSSAPNFDYSGNVSSTTDRVVLVEGLSGGKAEFSGNVTAGAGGQGILAQNNTGGTIRFNGSSKNLTTGANPAVNLTNNTGTTIEFIGGGLAINTTSGAGFNATGGGTVNVTGSLNTISSGSGTALNVQNTDIGGSGLSFRSISANGGANGIVLNNTGSANGLQVTGDGSTAGSGGTIQNTQTGASFASARNINLRWMNFASANTSDGAGTCDGLDNSGCTGVVKLTSVSNVALDRLGFSGTIAQQGIVGSTVNGISISNISISNAGNEQWEHGIKLFDVLGTANSITATTVTNAGNFNIFVQNSTSTNGVAGASDSLRIAGNTLSNPGSALQSDGITVATRATGNLKVVVDGNTFNTSRMATDGVQVDAGGSSKAVAVVTGNSIVGYNTAVNISGASTATNLFTVQNNPLLSSVAGATLNLASNGTAILRGTVKGNTNMTTTSTNNSTTGIDAIVDAGGVIVADIDGNTITGAYLAGIRAGARNAFNAGDADFTIRNNSITAQLGTTTPFAGLYMVAGNGSPGETNRTCMNLSNNQIVSAAPGAFDYDIYLESYNGGGYNNTFQIQGLTGSGSDPANVHNYVSSKDVGGARVQGFWTTGAETYTAATCATP